VKPTEVNIPGALARVTMSMTMPLQRTATLLWLSLSSRQPHRDRGRVRGRKANERRLYHPIEFDLCIDFGVIDRIFTYFSTVVRVWPEPKGQNRHRHRGFLWDLSAHRHDRRTDGIYDAPKTDPKACSSRCRVSLRCF
jgi:hypothetical protein